jgi:hypothetical protein
MLEADERRFDWIRQQAGNWGVEQRVWSSPTAESILLPPMVARRRMVADAFLEEVMEPAPGSGQEPFRRTAYLSFNPINRRYEHVTLDSRYRPIMFETSVDDVLEGGHTVSLFVSGFTSPSGFGDIPAGQWVKQRRLLIAEGPAQTITRQFWTFPGAAPYLAMEYVYTRQ